MVTRAKIRIEQNGHQSQIRIEQNGHQSQN